MIVESTTPRDKKIGKKRFNSDHTYCVSLTVEIISNKAYVDLEFKKRIINVSHSDSVEKLNKAIAELLDYAKQFQGLDD